MYDYRHYDSGMVPAAPYATQFLVTSRRYCQAPYTHTGGITA